ncbi:antibiotic biosynthesis monooxygenase [Jeongeupia wiesaeckerbachi]|uniref:antibiotic biosynthesis monooxygenase n=1 Tax=Jeongeupia wiesaeckerbachi TaxID=3051218 RepID=UPI003D8025B8
MSTQVADPSLRFYAAMIAACPAAICGATPMSSQIAPQSSVFRVDRFSVPDAALAAFIDRVERTNRLLAGLAGCKQQLVLTQAGDPHQVVTLIEWTDATALAAAKAVVEQQYRAEGFDPAAFMLQLGVSADMRVFDRI